VGPRAGLNRCGKSRPTGIRSPDRPARSQSLYQLSYPVHNILMEYVINDVLLSKCNVACSIAHSISCTRLFRGKMHSDCFNGTEILQGEMAAWKKKWDTVIPADLKRVFVSGTCMPAGHERVKVV